MRSLELPQAGGTVQARGTVQGRRYVDHPLRAAAGQTLTISLATRHSANHFNLLPPGSRDGAMAIGERTDNRFEGLLPDDGVYTVRVFLLRAAARRGERSDFTLSVGLSGTPLAPTPASRDALLPGTRFHSRSPVPCTPAYTATRTCEASVVRRGTGGSATVVLRWDRQGTRRILFVQGIPQASDAPGPLSFVRTERGWTVTIDGQESFEIPEPLVMGG